MTPQEILEQYQSLRPQERPAFVRSLSQEQRDALADELPDAVAQIVRMSDDEYAEYRAEIEAISQETTARMATPDSRDQTRSFAFDQKQRIADGDTVDRVEEFYNPSAERLARLVTRQKEAIVTAYMQATGNEMPQEYIATLQSIDTMEGITGFLRQLTQVDPAGEAVIDAYLDVRSGESTLSPVDSDMTMYELDSNGELRDVVTGELAPPEVTGAQAPGTSASDIPPAPDNQDAFLIGRPPSGFVAGVGYQDEELETEEMRQAEIDRARSNIERYRRNTAQFPGSLVAGKSEFAHELDALNTFTDGGGMESRYYEGEEWQFAWRSAGEVRVIQERLENAGLLKPNTYTPGMWDSVSARSMSALMGESNATGQTWEMQLARRLEFVTPEMLAETYGSASGGRTPFVAPAYMRPDQASLSQAVKALVRQKLKREPSARDMAELSDQMYSDYKLEYDAQVKALRSEYDATTRALESDSAQSAGIVQNVDPTARFRETFESRFANELQLRDDVDSTVEAQGKMQGAMQRLDSVIGRY